MLALLLVLAHAEEPPVPPPPIPPPAAVDGCVPPDAVAAYDAELEALATEALARALGDAVMVSRTGFLVDPGKEIDTTYEVDGKRFAHLGSWVASAAPTIRLARVGDTLHRVEPEPAAWEVVVPVCGASPCPTGGGAKVNVRALAIPLEQGEQLGPPLRPKHDSWWVLREYQASRHCMPPP